MSTLTKTFSKSQIQSFLLLGLSAFFVAHFALLSPSSLEEDMSESRTMKPDEVIGFFLNEPETLARSVPQKITPTYAMRELEFLSTDKDQQRWRMLARKSYSYEKEKILHGRDTTFIGEHGVVTSREATFSENTEIIELYGNVVATLKNGMVIESEYAKVLASKHTELLIPITEPVKGRKQLSKTSNFHFTALGMTYHSEKKELNLLANVELYIETDKPTHISSDYATYYEAKELIEATMSDKRPLGEQFTRTRQKDLDMKSRKLTANLIGQKTVQVLNAIGDVEFFDTTDPEHPVRGTGGRGKYFEKENLLFLMDFPQVYQDNDTITGDVIRYDRSHDIIEVDQSNAFNRK